MVEQTMRSHLAALAALTAATALISPPQAQATRIDLAQEWYDITARTIAAAPAPTQITNNRTWAISWLAAARAARHGHDRTFTEAAVATAVHDTLINLVPSQAPEVDRALATTLARIPNGPSKSRGTSEGSAQAKRILTERSGDGLDPASVNAPFVVPPAAPGAWRPTPPAYSPAIQYGNRAAKPFALRRADQFRPAPPPALDSARYQRDLAEARDFGSSTSTVRTEAQTTVASFWYQGSQPAFLTPLRVALTESRGSLTDRVTLVAVFNIAAVDTQIATSDAKYTYLLWRPVTALRAGGLPDWTPLHVTPAHPDYPSGHGTYAGVAEQVLTALTGPRTREPFELTSPTAPGVVFRYQAWRELSRDNVNARVWSGIHTRVADEVGVELGRKVGRYTLDALDRLVR
ncbi:PAP2 superfamily [Actinokineospora diospyrosa]|uniref:PAP2 superfamily n=1 Tax=Actinokineospora diospyrosa TaxID=103728 RepID=A0ABT1I5D7_9PSEU|nr:PAP2 superfamily [Actinokineospora diospyrosa]